MPLRFLIDENLRGILGRAVERHNHRTAWYPLDALRVGDVPDLPLGASDQKMLQWAEMNGRIVVSLDESTLPQHLADHLAVGRHVPGIFLVRPVAVDRVVEFLVCAAYASEPEEWQDGIAYIP